MFLCVCVCVGGGGGVKEKEYQHTHVGSLHVLSPHAAVSISRLSWTPFGGGSALSVAIHSLEV